MHNDVVFPARALIDPTSQDTFITRKLQSKLDLPTLLEPAAAVVGLNGAVAVNATKACIVSQASSIDPAFRLTTETYVVDKLTCRLPTCSLAKFVDFKTPDRPLRDLK